MSTEEQIIQLQKEIRQLPNYQDMDSRPLKEKTREFRTLAKSWFMGLKRKVKNGGTTGEFEKIRTQQLISMARQLAIRHHQINQKKELSTFESLTFELSQIFGNATGSIKWRKGHLLNDKVTQNQLKKILRPFDILLERSPFALTDYLIPGHFSHAAIWLGSPKQLKSRGLWELPILDGLREAIRNGKRVLEAVRPGVRLNSLRGFMSVDEVAVLRYRDIRANREQQKKILSIAMNQLGKDYDFNFDVMTSDYVICSELLYRAFWMIDWPTDNILGRETISPDHLAELAFYRNAPLKFVTYITAKQKNRGRERSVFDLADMLNFTSNKNGHFDKVERICKRKQWGRLRVGGHTRRHIHLRQCRKETTPLIYTPVSNEHSKGL